jgi:hypothetical protein
MTDDIKITVRLPAELHKTIAQVATAEQRSLNGQIIWLLNRAISQNIVITEITPGPTGPHLHMEIKQEGDPT